MFPHPVESVCVYCGSRHGDDLGFTHAARALGAGLAERGLRLIYGAGDVGLMGEVARSTMAAGGKAVGVIPRHLLDMEVGLRDLTAMIVTDTMHERKKIMFANADAVVALPGGAGTLDELIEVLTWRQLGLHDKPLILVDVNGYWRPFMDLLRHVVAHRFASETLLDFLTLVPDAEGALHLLARR
ncbi:MAG: TIGR00730 family Rossman fold protein [Rubrimonas sp.]|uniref:LOG family protein n=1 Tax=Rubrimonas sp. TaxID=2036015 RepID=UPI002FDE04D2